MSWSGTGGRPSVGVIGLGGMGTALSQELLRAGYAVMVHDRRTERIEELAAAGTEVADSAARLAENCGLVITFLPGPTEVEQVLVEDADSVLSGAREGTIVLDMSTCGPDTAIRVGDAFDIAGCVFVDCPVSRKAPEMTVLIGGEPGVLGAAETVLAAVSRTLVHCGSRGAGYATKLLNQHVKYAWYLASSEALLIAREWGLDAAAVAQAIERSSGGDSGLDTAAEFFRGDVAQMATHAPARTIHKDMQLVKQLAAGSSVCSPTVDVVADFFQRVAETPYLERPYPESTELLARLRRQRPSTETTTGAAESRTRSTPS
jgi:3-hydroxyisobutyrate dehydrogenase-like beta-hydroxyacid dehydrogenase